MWPAKTCRPPLGTTTGRPASAGIEIADTFGDKAIKARGVAGGVSRGRKSKVHRHGLGGLPIRQELDQPPDMTSG